MNCEQVDSYQEISLTPVATAVWTLHGMTRLPRLASYLPVSLGDH